LALLESGIEQISASSPWWALDIRRRFRGDAAFANPEIDDLLIIVAISMGKGRKICFDRHFFEISWPIGSKFTTIFESNRGFRGVKEIEIWLTNLKI
jgi:hypothetical protein